MKKFKKEFIKKIIILIITVLAIATIFIFINDRPTFAYIGSWTDDGSWFVSICCVITVAVLIIRRYHELEVNHEVEKQIKLYIPEFDKVQLLNKGYKIYYDIQKALKDSKLEDVKDLLSDELYNKYKNQLATGETKNKQIIMRNFLLNQSYLKKVQKQNNTITITAVYILEFAEYIENTNRGYERFVKYEMIFRLIDNNTWILEVEKVLERLQ